MVVALSSFVFDGVRTEAWTEQANELISGAQTFLFESGKALAPIAGRLPLFD